MKKRDKKEKVLQERERLRKIRRDKLKKESTVGKKQKPITRERALKERVDKMIESFEGDMWADETFKLDMEIADRNLGKLQEMEKEMLDWDQRRQEAIEMKGEDDGSSDGNF
jgi:hypothetical protein